MKLVILDDVVNLIKTLDKRAVGKVLRLINLLEKFGNYLEYPHSRKISDNIFELRIRGVQEVRIMYAFCSNDTAVLLRGYIKKTPKMPKRELELTQKRLAVFESVLVAT